MKKNKKIIMIIILVALAVIATAAFFIINKLKNKEEPVKDIVVDGDTITFDVDRKFYLYNENPLDVEDAEPIKEINVTLKGTADAATNEFEGEVNVEGFELGGNMQSYYFSKLDGEKKGEYTWDFLAEGVQLQDSETFDGKIYRYQITISSDLKTINFWITKKGNTEEWFWVTNSEY